MSGKLSDLDPDPDWVPDWSMNPRLEYLLSKVVSILNEDTEMAKHPVKKPIKRK